MVCAPVSRVGRPYSLSAPQSEPKTGASQWLEGESRPAGLSCFLFEHCFLKIFTYLKMRSTESKEERDREREFFHPQVHVYIAACLPCSGLHWSVLDQAEARNPSRVSSGSCTSVVGTQTLEPPSSASPKTLTVRPGASAICKCWHCRRWLNQLSYKASLS